MNLLDLKINESGLIISISDNGVNHQRLSEMGIIPGNIITLIKYAPMGDPIEFFINGYTLSLRKKDAQNINIEKTKSEIKKENIIISDSLHPGIGENGIFHNKKTETPLSNKENIKFALIGNPNSGKTTLFNNITGSNQHIGNFPGVTVEIKEGNLLNHKNAAVVDLPGVYSLTPYSSEESITTDFLIKNKINGIINIVDITSIERGLFLTLQLLELNIPMVIGLNMFDEFEKNKGYLNINALEERLGIPVVPISAINNQGIDELMEHAMHIAYYQEKPLKIIREPQEKNKIIYNTISAIEHLLTSKSETIPPLFFATKCLENNEIALKQINISDNEKHVISHIKEEMENEVGMDSSTAISSYRYSIIFEILRNIMTRNNEKETSLSSKIDKVLTGKYTAIPCFVLIMIIMFCLTFNIVGPYFQSVLHTIISNLAVYILKILPNNISPFIQSFIINGLINGIGTIISFIPTVLCLFLFLSILEDTGYISRIAFIMDKPLRKIGLSGRTIIPLLLGFGCTVPAILSTRTLTSKRDRRRTIFLLPFISCSAKLPIYGFFCNLFFKKYTGIIVSFLYFFGILLAISIAYISKKSKHKSETIPFIMELPPYRFPKIKNILINLWQKAKEYLKKTFSIILIATIIIWFLSSITPSIKYTSLQSESLLALIAKSITPIFKPLGFGNWQSITSLISGFIAKESVVSTLNVLTANSNIESLFTSASALSFLTFCLLYTPCIASISATKNESGYKDALLLVLYQCVIAWIVSFAVYQFALIII